MASCSPKSEDSSDSSGSSIEVIPDPGEEVRQIENPELFKIFYREPFPVEPKRRMESHPEGVVQQNPHNLEILPSGPLELNDSNPAAKVQRNGHPEVSPNLEEVLPSQPPLNLSDFDTLEDVECKLGDTVRLVERASSCSPDEGVDIPKTGEEQVKKSKLSQEDDFSSDEELSEPEVPEDKKDWTWELAMYLEKTKQIGQAEESLAGPTQEFLDLKHAVRDSTHLPNKGASCPNPQHPNQEKTGQLSELHRVIREWMETNIEFQSLPFVPKRNAKNNLNNSWLDIFYQVAANKHKKPTEPIFIDFAKLLVIYGWILEDVLDWQDVFAKLKDIHTSSDLTETLQRGLFSDMNEATFLVTLSDCLKYMEDETVVQNFLQELKSRTRPTFLLSTLFRLLHGITEPKSRKDIMLDKLVFKYFITVRGIFLAFGRDDEGLGTVYIPRSSDVWNRHYIDTHQAVTLCNALLKKFLEESKRIREKYDYKTETQTGIVFSESWEVRRKFINILRRVMIASCMQVKAKFDIWSCGACYEKSIEIEK